jgi:hypothetical protein
MDSNRSVRAGTVFRLEAWWPSLVTLLVAVPSGMLFNEWLKLAVHRTAPLSSGRLRTGLVTVLPVATRSGLLYGQLLLFVLPLLKMRHLRLLCIFGAASLVLLVGFTRIALGALFLTDALAAIFSELLADVAQGSW